MKMTTLRKVCPFCGNVNFIKLPADKVSAWENGELIQNVFPDVAPNQREMLITGICIECQVSIFDSEED